MVTGTGFHVGITNVEILMF